MYWVYNYIHVDHLRTFIYQRIILLDYFSRKFYDYVVNCILLHNRQFLNRFLSNYLNHVFF